MHNRTLLVILLEMPAKQKNDKRPREELAPSSDIVQSPATTADTCKPTELVTEVNAHEATLCAQGEALSGNDLREFLKRNFLDFADEESSRISAIAGL